MKEFRIVIDYYLGDVSVSDIKELMRIQSSDPDYSTEFDSIQDFRDCNVLVTPNDIIPYVDFIQNILKIINNRKVAFLTNDPTKVVTGMLFAKKVYKKGIISEVFTTSEALLDFLSKEGLEKSVLENAINEIKIAQPIIDGQ